MQPVGFGFKGGSILEGRVQPSRVVPALDPTDDLAARFGSGGEPAPVHELPLERGEERLHGLLSKQIPVAPIDWVTPSCSHSWRYSPDVYWIAPIGMEHDPVEVAA